MTASKDGFRHRNVAVGDALLHVVEAGDPGGAPFLFLHGWPESWQSWRQVMAVAARPARPVAVDLPGIGESSGAATDGSKRQLAAVVHELIATLGLRDVTLVGQDVGGMVAYPYLRTYQDVARVVIMDVVLPGVEPWEEVLRNPYLWHFAMHMIPGVARAARAGPAGSVLRLLLRRPLPRAEADQRRGAGDLREGVRQ
jgi:pimeloyl-ACP methyl ester carboxylesterase